MARNQFIEEAKALRHGALLAIVNEGPFATELHDLLHSAAATVLQLSILNDQIPFEPYGIKRIIGEGIRDYMGQNLPQDIDSLSEYLEGRVLRFISKQGAES